MLKTLALLAAGALAGSVGLLVALGVGLVEASRERHGGVPDGGR